MALPPILPAPKPARPRPAPPPPRTNTRTGANPRGVAITAPRPKPTINDHAARTLATGNNPRGVAIAQRPAGGQTVHDAVRAVFKHQNPAGQARILQGIKAGKADRATANAVREAVGQMSGPDRLAMMQHFVGSNHASIDADLKGLGRIFNPSNVYGSHGAGTGSENQGGLLGSVTPFGGKKGAEQILKNTGKDAVNLPAETFSTIGTLGGDVLGGHFGKAASDIAAPYKQLLAHPSQSFYQHPLNTYLMAAGPVHGATRVAADAARVVAPKSGLVKALGPRHEVPPSVHLTGELTHERPALSPYPLIRAGQKVAAKTLYEKSPTGDLVPKTPFLRERLLRHEVSRSLVGVRERIRRQAVDQQKHAHAVSVLRSPAGRLAHSARKALTYDPGSALIHGANVLARVADHTVRKPETLVTDLQKHLSQVASTRPDLIGMPLALADHDKYVAELKAAIADKGLGNAKNVQRLFDAAHRYARDLKPMENEAFGHNHYGKIPKEGLLRRELQPVVLSHMPGARLDPVLGMVKDVSRKEAAPAIIALRAEASRLEKSLSERSHANAGKALAAHALEKEKALRQLHARIDALTERPSRQLSTAEMVAFDKAETGGRPLAYTSHQIPKGDAAFYTSGQKYPARAIQKNSGYAFAHGLTDPTHEALLQHRAEIENAINAHRSMDKILQSTVQAHPEGGFWKTFKDAKADAPPGMVPIQVGRLTVKGDHATEGIAGLDREASIRSLDINERLRPTDQPGKFGLIDKIVKDQLRQHENQISPNTFLRAARASTSQFRRVALGTSFKHLPGVAQEGLIRDIGAGIGVRSLASGRNVFDELEKIDPRLGAERRVEIAGGTMGGMTRMMETRQGSKYFGGTALGPPMRAVEKLMKAPGPRQMSTAWNHWQDFVIGGTKKVLEQNQQIAAAGQALLKESGKLMHLQGDAARDAAKGLLSDAKARQLAAQVRRVHGTWTDLTPSGQTLLMFSPFGMWWVNSVKWLARMPVDQPIKTGLLAGATTGTQKERQAIGLDMFSPNHLAGYLQGTIPNGSKLIASNYYSPFGVANDPLETVASLTEPTLMPAILALLGDNYLGKRLRTPQDPHGDKDTNGGTRALVALNSVFSNFLPLYMKFQTVAQGGASSYDTSTAFKPQTKKPNPGVGQGLLKIVNPLRQYSAAPRAASSSGGGWGGGSSGSSGGWGGGSSSSGGWG